MIVPDTIEPVLGWKALLVDDKGLLYSPRQPFRWPPKDRAEALCMKASYRWQPRQGKPPEERDPRRFIVVAPHNRVTLQTTNVPFVSTSWSAPFPQITSDEEEEQETPPQIELPDGMHWSWEPYQHEAASDNGCSCGIYMVDTPSQCGFYINEGTLLANVYGWGHVIQGQQGNRVQYAYPKELVASEYLRAKAELAAEQYGVPVMIIPDHQLPDKKAQLEALNKAFSGLTAQQKEATRLIQSANMGVGVPGPPQEIPPATPFVKAAVVGLLCTVVSVINYFTLAGRSTVSLISMGLCAFIVLLCLFIDFMIFCADEKANRA